MSAPQTHIEAHPVSAFDSDRGFLGMLARAGDPNSGGRNVPEHFSYRALNLLSQTAGTGTQYLSTVGAAKAVQSDGIDAVVHS